MTQSAANCRVSPHKGSRPDAKLAGIVECMTLTHSAALAERRISAPAEHRAGELQPASWNAEARTVDVVWTTGSRGAKFDWDAGLVDEELATAPSNVRLDRLNSGAPVLNSHQRSDLASQIGIVVPGSARMDRGRGLATIRLSDRGDLAPIVADIAAGIIRNVSVGYTVLTYEIEQRQGQRPLYRAVDWEPFEISFVPVPFDAAAQVRSRDASTDRQPCTLRTRQLMETDMPRNLTDPLTPASAATPPSPTPSELRDRPATIAQLRQLGDQVAESYGVDRQRCSDVILDMAERGLTIGDASSEMLQALTERQRSHTGSIGGGGSAYATVLGGGQTFDNPDFHARAIEDTIYARLSGSAPSDQAREFMSMSMVQLAGDMLTRRGVRDVVRMAPSDVLEAAAFNRVGARAAFINARAGSFGPAMTTSDFPDLLGAAGQRFLLDIFAAAASPLKLVGRERSARDFRDISGLQISGFGTLPKVPEDGEIKRGSFSARKETYRLESFAKMFSLSRQAIINDDLGVFADPIRVMARASAETEAQVLADLLNSNPVLASDATPLFHANHGNLAPTGSGPSVPAFNEARLGMRSQKDDDKVTPLATAPKYIVTSPKYETDVDVVVTASFVPTTADAANPFSGKLTPLVDPRLTAAPWYMFADPALTPVLEYAYLQGKPGPQIEMQDVWDRLATSWRVYMDFGAGIVDYRGVYKNPGI
jgi:hypothetical protein